jgi:hypothetical protein
MSQSLSEPHIYEGEGDRLIGRGDVGDHIVLLPDEAGSMRDPDPTPRVRIMWGQRLIDDLLAGRYRSVVCAVNADDNSHGIIAQLADLLPTSQWTPSAITQYAKHFVQPHTVTVVKIDMDAVEVLALLRPSEHDHLTLEDLGQGFRIVTAMLHRRPERMPAASVCFLGARANRLIDHGGAEPAFETVLATMYEGGYRGDVYAAPWMWESSGTGVFARYPFPDSVRRMREGGF